MKKVSLNDTEAGEACDTLFYQGNGCSQTQALKYVGESKIQATTGELMWCTGRNNLPPLQVIYKLYIGCEIMDVNLHPFNSYISMLNPISLVASGMSWVSNWSNGYHFLSPPSPIEDSVQFHAPILSQLSIGQETDVISHQNKYICWQASEDKTQGLILWGVSRGTAATVCAFSKFKYPEVRLVILEGAIDSIDEVLSKRVSSYLKSDYLSHSVTGVLNTALSFFNQRNLLKYKPGGLSPLKCVVDFPEGIPIVFITSKVDTVVSVVNTKNVAQAFVDRAKNDVYLLILERSSHPNYMFDDREDRDHYEQFIHAIYRKYHLKHELELASLGEKLLGVSTLFTIQHEVEMSPELSPVF
jgi:hypothetical protein